MRRTRYSVTCYLCDQSPAAAARSGGERHRRLGMVSAYHVRPTLRGRLWRVELQGARGHESRVSRDQAQELARLLARANRPSVVVVHESSGQVRVSRRYAETQVAPSPGSRQRPASRIARAARMHAGRGL